MGFGFDNVEGATVVEETTLPTAADELGGDFQFDEPTGGGKYPPRITPGPVDIRFECVEVRERDNGVGEKKSLHALANGKVPTIIYTAHVQVAALAPGRLLKDSGESEIAVRFNEASGFKSKAMADKHVSTDIERLYAALGLLAEFGPPKSLQQMVDMIKGCGSSRIGKGWTLGWSAAVKTGDGTYEVYSTKPNVKRGEKAIPRGTDGKLLTEIKFSNGEERTCREEIFSINVPKASKAGATT